ncbi:MAG: hypothetical protein ABL984_21005, partial [Pyrinomonadaceae bacterium]
VYKRQYSHTGDFSGILERLAQRRYKKILVRNLHEPDFWYDYQSWESSSNIRKILLENYQEIGRIKKPEGMSENEIQYGFRGISILVPRLN